MTLEKSATLEPTKSDMTVPKMANPADTKLKKSAFFFCEAGIEKDKKIAQLMWNFVKNHSEGRRDADVKTDIIRSADYNAVDKIVSPIRQ
jgi:hypothetical protein